MPGGELLDGDTVHVEGEVESLREVDGLTGLVVFNWRVVNQRGDAVVLAKARVVWRREAEPAVAVVASPEVFL